MYIGLLAIINVLAAFLAAHAAKEKGRSPILFWFITFFTSFIIGLILIAVLKNKNTEEAAEEADISNFKNNFVGKYLIFIILAVMLTISTRVFGGLIAERGADFLESLDRRLFFVFAIVTLTGFSALLTMHARGLDLSILSMMGWGMCLFINYSTAAGSVWIGMAVALIGCALSGLLLGVFIWILKLPAYIPSLLWGLALAASTTIFYDYSLIHLDSCMVDTAANTIWFGLIMVLAAFLITFLVILFSKLKKPLYQRTDDEKKGFVHIFAYALSGLFAAAAGVVLTLVLRTGNIAGIESYTVYIIAIFAILLSTKVAEKKEAPALIVVGSAAVLSLFNYAVLYQGAAFFDSPGYIASSMVSMVIILLIIMRITHKKTSWAIENF